MKRIIVIILLSALALPLFTSSGRDVVGRIRIPAVDLSAEVYGTDETDCGCCPALWNGGRVSTASDLSGVCIDDVAHLTLLSGQRLVLECAEVTPCIRLGPWLVSWRGIVEDNGDVLIINCGKVYRWIRL